MTGTLRDGLAEVIRDAYAVDVIPSETLDSPAWSDLVGTVEEWLPEADAALAYLAQQRPGVEAIAGVLREHMATGGMSVASGVTCRCGYWTGNEEPGKTRPVGYSGLQWHQAEAVAAHILGRQV